MRSSVAILVLHGNSFREKKEKLQVIEQFQHFPLRRGSVLCELIVQCFNRSLPRGCRKCAVEVECRHNIILSMVLWKYEWNFVFHASQL
jgi:predicted aldo/keto reductase-like oxidoreductase